MLTKEPRGRLAGAALNSGLRSIISLVVVVGGLSACAAPSPASSAVTARPTSAASVVSPTESSPVGSSEAFTACPTSEPSGRIRPAAVAGSWYPRDPDQLSETIVGMLDAGEPVYDAPVGLIVPHAGFAFSGPIAAAGFRQLREGEYDVAVIIASDHQEPLSDPVSVWAEGGFETPLGVVAVDEGIAQALVEADPQIASDPDAHQGEHPIEIELPFLQRVCPACRIVPILMGDDQEETVQALVDALLSVLPDEKVVVVASSDLSHYPSYEDARAVDGATLGAIETFDPAKVRGTVDQLAAAGVSNLATCACGKGPILVTMHVAKGLGADTVTVLQYRNSGDVTDDHSRVVGYGAVMLWDYEPPALTAQQREMLLKLTRTTLESYLEGGDIPELDPDADVLRGRSGAFVTLKEKGKLRGCVGHRWGDLPLYQAVQQAAVQAATEDRRFSPLTVEALSEIDIQISVLSPFRRVTDVEQIQVGTHGLMIYKDGRQGLLLPQVAVEQDWDRDAYLENLCRKAGLRGDCWHNGATLYAFTALVFDEG